MSEFGKLYIVATPIGNLADLSLRAIDILKKVSLIAAEDTRHAAKLLNHFSINTKSISCHEHNEEQRVELIAESLTQGKSVALISDAGTPLISDPGYVLVSKLRDRGFDVTPVPGPCALIAALSVSGLPTDSFSFFGFLPSKSSQRTSKLKSLMGRRETLVFYESTHRIEKCLEDIGSIDANRQIVIAREISKTFETVLSGTAKEIVAIMEQDHNQQKGEFVLMVAGHEQVDSGLSEKDLMWLQALLEVMPVSKASQLVAKVTGLKKQQVYQIAESIKN